MFFKLKPRVLEIYIYFKTEPDLATPTPSAGNSTRDPMSLDQRSTDWATEAVAVSLRASSVRVKAWWVKLLRVNSHLDEPHKDIS